MLDGRHMDLVLGGSGFIGQHIVYALLEEGRSVRVYDLAPFPSDGLQPAEVIRGDIRSAHGLKTAMKGVDRVFHAAGTPQLWHPSPSFFDEINRRGTEVVLSVAEEVRPRALVYTSTESILTLPGNRDAIQEDTEPTLEAMIGPYCRSKFLAEEAALEHARRGHPVIVTNPTLPVGPGDRNLTPPTRMIHDFTQGKIPAYIRCCMNLVDVRDVAIGHLRAAEHGTPGKRHILSGENWTLKQLFDVLARWTDAHGPRWRIPYAIALITAYVEEAIGRWTGRPPKSSVTGVKLCRRGLAFDGRLTWARLGHHPRPIENSLYDAVNWLKAQNPTARHDFGRIASSS